MKYYNLPAYEESSILMDESKSKSFVRLAEARMNKALEDIRRVGNLSNKNNYNYTETQAKKIVNSLKAAVHEVELKFKSKNSKNDFKF